MINRASTGQLVDGSSPGNGTWKWERGDDHELSQDRDHNIDCGNAFLCSFDDSSESYPGGALRSPRRMTTHRHRVCRHNRALSCPITSCARSGMVLGRIRLPGLDHPLRHRRQLSRQPAADHCRSLDLRFAVPGAHVVPATASRPSSLSHPTTSSASG